MKWDDLKGEVWRIPSANTKNKTAHVVPLPRIALREIEAVKPITGAGTYVFASLTKPDQHIKEFAHVTKRIRQKQNCQTFDYMIYGTL